MTRADLQNLAAMRLKDAKALLSEKRYAASYYLAGYAVECAIKACIAKQFRRHSVPERKVVNGFYSHDLGELVKWAGLDAALRADALADLRFDANWNMVKDWTPESRYDSSIDRARAESLYNAISDTNHGVAQWLRRRW